MTTKHIYQSSALVAVAFLGSFATWSVIGQSSGTRTVPALTYDLVLTQPGPDGKVVEAGREIHAVRSDGSQATIASYKGSNGIPFEIRHIDNLTTRTQHTINPAVESITSMPITAGTANWLLSRARTCGQDPAAEKAKILGYDVVKNTLRPGAAGALTVETWSAPSLGCVALKLTMLRDGQVLVVRQAENIQVGEPASQLFTIPAGLKEMSPSEVARALQEKTGRIQFPPNSVFESTAEEAYRKRRAEVGLSSEEG